MKKIIASLGLCFALMSCNKGAVDGYSFEKSSVLLGDRAIKIVRYPSMNALRAAFTAKAHRRLPSDRQLMAFSAFNDKTCTIHMLDPSVNYQPEWIGHELTHCLYGEFHPHQND